jgi:hypothetical protein
VEKRLCNENIFRKALADMSNVKGQSSETSGFALPREQFQVSSDPLDFLTRDVETVNSMFQKLVAFSVESANIAHPQRPVKRSVRGMRTSDSQ